MEFGLWGLFLVQNIRDIMEGAGSCFLSKDACRAVLHIGQLALVPLTSNNSGLVLSSLKCYVKAQVALE